MVQERPQMAYLLDVVRSDLMSQPYSGEAVLF